MTAVKKRRNEEKNNTQNDQNSSIRFEAQVVALPFFCLNFSECIKYTLNSRIVSTWEKCVLLKISHSYSSYASALCEPPASTA